MLHQEQVQKIKVATRELRQLVEQSNQLRTNLIDSNNNENNINNIRKLAPTAAAARKLQLEQIESVEWKIITSLSFAEDENENNANNIRQQQVQKKCANPLIDSLLQASVHAMKTIFSSSSKNNNNNNNIQQQLQQQDDISSLFVDLLGHPNTNVMVAAASCISSIASQASNNNNNNDNDDSEQNDNDQPENENDEDDNPYTCFLNILRSRGAWSRLISSVLSVSRSEVFSSSSQTYSQWVKQNIFPSEKESTLLESSFKIFQTVLTTQAIDAVTFWNILEFVAKSVHRLTSDFFTSRKTSSSSSLTTQFISNDLKLSTSVAATNNFEHGLNFDENQKEEEENNNNIEFLLNCSVFSQQQEQALSSGLELISTILENFSIRSLITVNDDDDIKSSKSQVVSQQNFALHFLMRTLFSLYNSAFELYNLQHDFNIANQKRKEQQENIQEDDGELPKLNFFVKKSTATTSDKNEVRFTYEKYELSPLDLICIDSVLSDVASIMKLLSATDDENENNNNSSLFSEYFLKNNINNVSLCASSVCTNCVKMLRNFVAKPPSPSLSQEEEKGNNNNIFVVGGFETMREIRDAALFVLDIFIVSSSKSSGILLLLIIFSNILSAGFLGVVTPLIASFSLEKQISEHTQKQKQELSIKKNGTRRQREDENDDDDDDDDDGENTNENKNDDLADLTSSMVNFSLEVVFLVSKICKNFYRFVLGGNNNNDNDLGEGMNKIKTRIVAKFTSSNIFKMLLHDIFGNYKKFLSTSRSQLFSMFNNNNNREMAVSLDELLRSALEKIGEEEIDLKKLL